MLFLQFLLEFEAVLDHEEVAKDEDFDHEGTNYKCFRLLWCQFEVNFIRIEGDSVYLLQKMVVVDRKRKCRVTATDVSDCAIKTAVFNYRLDLFQVLQQEKLHVPYEKLKVLFTLVLLRYNQLGCFGHSPLGLLYTNTTHILRNLY